MDKICYCCFNDGAIHNDILCDQDKTNIKDKIVCMLQNYTNIYSTSSNRFYALQIRAVTCESCIKKYKLMSLFK